MVSHAVYPTSLELPDLFHDESSPGRLERDRPEDDCALCRRGICVQRIEDHEGAELIIHGVLRQ